jgi:hypothetical protein
MRRDIGEFVRNHEPTVFIDNNPASPSFSRPPDSSHNDLGGSVGSVARLEIASPLPGEGLLPAPSAFFLSRSGKTSSSPAGQEPTSLLCAGVIFQG